MVFWVLHPKAVTTVKSSLDQPLPEVLSSGSDKAKLFPKNFSKNSNLDDSGISLPIFLSRTNLKLHDFVNTKMVKKVIMNLDSSKTSDPDCITMVVLKN